MDFVKKLYDLFYVSNLSNVMVFYLFYDKFIIMVKIVMFFIVYD